MEIKSEGERQERGGKNEVVAVRVTLSFVEWSSLFGLGSKQILSRSSLTQTLPLSFQDWSSYFYSPIKLAPHFFITALGF